MALNFEHTWSWIFLIPVACISICWYLISIYWFWWTHRFPVAVGYTLLKSLGVKFQTLKKKDEDSCKALGKIHVQYENHKPVVSVTDPDLIKEILAPRCSVFRNDTIQKRNQITDHCSATLHFSQGSWESVRRRISLAFSPGKFRRTSHIMEHCCQKLCELLTSESKRMEFIDMKKLFDDFCMNTTFYLMFGVNKHASEEEKVLIAQALDLLRINLRRNTSFVPKDTGQNLKPFLETAFMSDRDLLKLEEDVSRIMKKRVENNQIKTDFLQLLMESFSPDKNANELHAREGLHCSFTLSKVPSSNLVTQCLLFFANGYRMISSVLSLVVYNLALNPNYQERLRKELKEVLLLEKQIDFNSVGKMAYLDQVICETLRLYPPVNRLQRFAVEEYPLGEGELVIPKGSEVNIPLNAIHRNSNHYPNPENFDPRRFTPMQWSKRHPYAFTPFGVGTRNCIGMKLALMEIKVFLVHLMRNFRFVKASKTKIPVEFHENEILTEPKEVQLHVEKVTA